jgi:hypothetical protein
MLVLICVLSLCIFPIPVSAQTPGAEVNESFTRYGHMHVLTHPADPSQYNFIDVEALENELERAARYYDGVWRSADPDLWIVLGQGGGNPLSSGYGVTAVPVPGSNPPSTATRTVCEIQVDNSPSLQNESFRRFILAFAMALCYEDILIPAAGNLTRLPLDSAQVKINAWWRTGAATWLATSASQPLPDNLSGFDTLRDSFLGAHPTSLIGATDHVWRNDALFFWEALEHNIGVNAAISFLGAMPGTAEAQAAYLGRRPDIDRLFEFYGLEAAWGLLPFQPAAEGLFNGLWEISAIPSSSPDIAIKKFSINPMILKLRISVPQGLALSVRGLASSGVTVTLNNGISMTEGTPVPLCDLEDAQIKLVASRANQGQRETIGFSVSTYQCPPHCNVFDSPSDPLASHPSHSLIRFSVNSSPCTPPQTSDPCYYGTWRLARLPHFTGTTLDMSFEGIMQVTLDRGGAAMLQYKDFALTTTTAGHTVKVVMNGTLVNSVRIDSTGHATGTPPTGFETLTAQAYINDSPTTTLNVANMISSMGGGLPTNMRLVCSEHQLLENVNLDSIVGPYTFER